MYPRQIEKELEKLHESYLEAMQELAEKLMNQKLVPYLTKKRLSLTCMNGFLQCYNEEGDQVELPKVISNLLDVQAPCGYSFYWSLPDFNPFKQNFSDLDVENHRKKYKNLTEGEATLSCWQTINNL